MSSRWASCSSPVLGSLSWPVRRCSDGRSRPDDLDGPGRRGRGRASAGHEAALDEQQPPVVELQRRDDDRAADAVLRAVDDEELLGRQVGAARRDRAPLDAVGVGAGHEHVVERRRRVGDALAHLRR